MRRKDWKYLNPWWGERGPEGSARRRVGLVWSGRPCSVVEFPEDGPEPQFDESDLPSGLQVVNGSKKLIHFTSTVANQLLMVSLLEHLCHMYTQNPARSRHLFKILGHTFTRMGLLSSFALCDEFSTLRLHHNKAITELMKAANQQTLNGDLENGDSHTAGEKEAVLEAQTSRYLNEFEEVARLGKGGYGKVYKVRNKLDGQFYAVKKILIKKATKRDCMKVLREVKVLAGLQHSNIVGYHTAWIEHVHPGCSKGKILVELPSLKISSDDQESGKGGCHSQCSSSVIFAESSSKEKKSCGHTYFESPGDESAQYMDISHDFTGGNSEDCLKMKKCEQRMELRENCMCDTTSGSSYFGNHSSYGPHSNLDKDCVASSDSCTEETTWSQETTSVHRPCEVEYHLMLHIQMQLCEISLSDWIVDRNKRCGEKTVENSSPYHLVDVHWTSKIFKELLEGVYHIHRMGVMHRDIKPRNIFLYGSDHQVKIGDFGLACREILQEDTDHWFETKGEKYNEEKHRLRHTSGVGTCLYASPEQLQGSQYDFKSDMYSLGVILLELFQPFGTEMERIEVLTELRNGHIQSSFSREWPVEAKYIKLLTSKVSSQRPTAAQLLESELFHTTERVICILKQKVKQKEEEIEKLKEKIKWLLKEREQRAEYKELGSPV
ncbi:eukaryotic translation initiation factor 2-alpha kinase 1 [Alligator sinensis]|uniref:Eukaryotic translation initiation factor 2-alpha kinase 1 n=1 Tax=Alligator sinensis TaxID=38654 RepID=A0A1U8DCS7_ALLSI|nr:eukaryotic translation initiation factor 2-alpha kinase 1 [Alligator sinensis]